MDKNWKVAKKNGLKNEKGLELEKKGCIPILEVTEKHSNPVDTQKAPFTVPSPSWQEDADCTYSTVNSRYCYRNPAAGAYSIFI